ncbi:MAG: acylphosphatase [Pseudomonadota bacterium]
MAIKTIRAKVSGRVQGVFFRAFTQEEAERLNLLGWVRNLPDRSVEALISGEAEQVDRMIAWLHKGSPGAEVRGVVVESCVCDEKLSDFAIRY